MYNNRSIPNDYLFQEALMNEELLKYFQSMVDKDYDSLLLEGVKTLSLARKVFLNRNIDENITNQVLIVFILTAVAADGKLSEPEEKFIGDILGIKSGLAAAIEDLSKNKELFESVNRTVDHLSTDEKSILCHLAVIIAAVDQTIDSNELDYIFNLLA